jgi:putative ABC transport system permease protein
VIAIGPLLRAMLRRRTAFALMVLESVSGFTVISCLVLAGTWYATWGRQPSGHEEADLIAVRLRRTVVAPDAATPLEALGARIGALPDVVAVAPVSAVLMFDGWGYPTSFSAASRAGDSSPGRSTSGTLGGTLGGLQAGVGSAGPLPGLHTSTGWPLFSSAALPAVLGLRFVEGAGPGAGDETGATVLTRCLRERLFPAGAAAVGERITAQDGEVLRVTGVVEDVLVRPPFLPDANCAALRFGLPPDERQLRFLVRARPGRRAAVMQALAGALGPSDATRLVTIVPFDSSRGGYQTTANGLVSFMAISAATVAAIVLISALAVFWFLVIERTRQIGIRRALGATRASIVAHFIVESSVATAVGAGAGLVLTFGAYALMRQVFPGLPLEPRALALTALLLWIDNTLAVLIPARRAALVAPSVASQGR